MFEPTEEMKSAYRWARLPPEISLATDLADLALHATAAALRHEHYAFCMAFRSYEKCKMCDRLDADWLRLADEKLREVKR